MASKVSADTSASSGGFGFLAQRPYDPPSWASHLSPIPSHIFSLGHLPTPIHKWNLPNLPPNTEVWLKERLTVLDDSAIPSVPTAKHTE